jgi:catechol 2,3-dioxygenase-like lactoylglutathione lyase family enzyme
MGAVHLDHVQLAAPPGCEEQARDFYGGLLGLGEIRKPEALRARGGVWFELDGAQQLHIGVEDPFTPARKAHPALAVEPRRLDELAARFTHAGVEVVWDHRIAAARRFYVADPWGNRLEILAARALDGLGGEP